MEDKLFVRMTDWIKDKDPERIVDIASKECCVCCAIKDIPEQLKGMWVFTEQVHFMKEALYASKEMRQAHQDSELIWIVDLLPKIDIADLCMILGKWDMFKIMYAAFALAKYFKKNGVEVDINTHILTDEQIEWINQRKDELFDLVNDINSVDIDESGDSDADIDA